jgi:hypothetical protein
VFRIQPAWFASGAAPVDPDRAAPARPEAGLHHRAPRDRLERGLHGLDGEAALADDLGAARQGHQVRAGREERGQAAHAVRLPEEDRQVVGLVRGRDPARPGRRGRPDVRRQRGERPGHVHAPAPGAQARERAIADGPGDVLFLRDHELGELDARGRQLLEPRVARSLGDEDHVARPREPQGQRRLVPTERHDRLLDWERAPLGDPRVLLLDRGPEEVHDRRPAGRLPLEPEAANEVVGEPGGLAGLDEEGAAPRARGAA